MTMEKFLSKAILKPITLGYTSPPESRDDASGEMRSIIDRSSGVPRRPRIRRCRDRGRGRGRGRLIVKANIAHAMKIHAVRDRWRKDDFRAQIARIHTARVLHRQNIPRVICIPIICAESV